ncbi:MAG: sugar phosphate isomerase/epimerase [Microbacteriaceae bacterium]
MAAQAEGRRIAFGTDLITFYNLGYWGLPPMPYTDWIAAFKQRPRYYFEAMLDRCVEVGLDGIEIAPDPGGWDTMLEAFGGIAGVKAALDSRGLAVGSSYSGSAEWIVPALEDPEYAVVADAHYRAHARFLAELECPTIVTGNVAREYFSDDVDGPVPTEAFERVAEQLDRLGSVTSPLGVRIAVHTDAYSICARREDVATLMSLTDAVSVGLCPDAGHITLDGGDAAAVLRDQVARVPVMHWKDCASPLHPSTLSGPKMHQHETMLTRFRVLGAPDGLVDWYDWQRTLRAAGWSGWAMAEIDMAADPVGDIRSALVYYSAELAPIYT